MKKTPYQPEESSANKLAAKAMKRKLEEADNSTKQQDVGSSTRYVVLDLSVHKKKDDDGDLHLAQKIMQNKQNTISGQADDEYDFEDCPSGKSWKKRRGNDNAASEKAMAKRLRGSIPKDFPYFHVEFGLDKGFVHVIDDEKQFKSSFGLDVITHKRHATATRGGHAPPSETRVRGGTKAGSDKICSRLGTI
ncbi:hypothetical protein LWI29_018224 [Acer saccharum]|uniref:Cwf19-like protein C-terminal domain-containing protein n=1 Tax=Acer saccharum TaxID=4024 RepID=A0AA39RM01_ACESA|nr:hypothetical protein LWI29_018224 [Acer saccharum]